MGAVLMAAGAGRRMGYRPKSLLRREDGKPLIAHHLRALVAAGLSDVVVVLGHHADRIGEVLQQEKQSAASPSGLQWVLNLNPDDGPGSSLRCALAALPADLDAVLVTLADQPLITAADMLSVLTAWRARAPGTALLVPRFQGQPGHPLMFDTRVRRDLMAQPVEAGLRDWRRAHPAQVAWLDANHPRYTFDIDTEADLARLAAEHGVVLR